jgi:hypothetical protein
MKVIGHKNVGDDFDSGEICDLMKMLSKHFFGLIVEEVFAVHRAGDAMVEGLGVVRFETCLVAHETFHNGQILKKCKKKNF